VARILLSGLGGCKKGKSRERLDWGSDAGSSAGLSTRKRGGGWRPAVLVASELATSAIIHAETPYRVAIDTNDVIRIEVSDESPEPPTVTSPPHQGLGLQIVDKLSAVWGALPFNGYRKVVWAEISRSRDWPTLDYK
jgi:hypothetical protein